MNLDAIYFALAPNIYMMIFLIQIISNKIEWNKFCNSFVVCFSLFVSISHQNLFAQTQLDKKIERNVPSKIVSTQITQWQARANRGDREAQFRLGHYYATQDVRQGNSQTSVESNLSRAAYWYNLASQQNHTLAQYNLGVQYMEGKGVDQNDDLALDLWLKAANAGHIHAQFNVGLAYYLGISFEKNYTQARYWFEQAAKHNDPRSLEFLAKLDSISDKNTLGNPAELVTNSSQQPGPLQEPSVQESSVQESSAIEQELMPIKASSKKEKLVQSTGETIAQQAAIAGNVPVYSAAMLGSKLIASRYDKNSLSIQKKFNSGWMKVTSDIGFPVWVHSDYVDLQGNLGVLIASRVQARAEPDTSFESIVDVFMKGEQVEFIEQQGDWYKVTAPLRFSAWVHEKDW